jgi:hypothetical protein
VFAGSVAGYDSDSVQVDIAICQLWQLVSHHVGLSLRRVSTPHKAHAKDILPRLALACSGSLIVTPSNIKGDFSDIPYALLTALQALLSHYTR